MQSAESKQDFHSWFNFSHWNRHDRPTKVIRQLVIICQRPESPHNLLIAGVAPPNAMFVCVTRCPAPRVSGALSRAAADNINMDLAVTMHLICRISSWMDVTIVTVHAMQFYSLETDDFSRNFRRNHPFCEEKCELQLRAFHLNILIVVISCFMTSDLLDKGTGHSVSNFYFQPFKCKCLNIKEAYNNKIKA